MPKIRGTVKRIKLSALKPNSWNPNRQDDYTFERQRNSITTFDFLQAIIARSVGRGKYEIIDGEHRWKAAKELGMEEIEIRDLGKVSDAEAKQLTEVFIHLHGQPDLAKEQILLNDLVKNFDVALEDLSHVLPMAVDQLESIIGAMDFDWKGEPPADLGGEKTGDNRELGQHITDPRKDAGLQLVLTGLTEAQFDIIQQAILNSAEESAEEAIAAICRVYLEQ